MMTPALSKMQKKEANMKRIAGLVAVLAVAGVMTAAADDQKMVVTPTNGVKAADVKKVEKAQVNCPILKDNAINKKDAIDKKLFVDFDGKRIYVCCPMCLATVQKDPAKYIKQLEDQGITLDKTPKMDVPKVEVPKTPETGVTVPAVEAPKMDMPKVEAPKMTPPADVTTPAAK